MKTYQPTSKGQECRVCSDTSGKCRLTDSELILCMNCTEEGSAIGWKFKGKSKDNLWGKWVPIEAETEAATAQREERRRETEAAEADRLARLKPRQQRDSEYRYKIANYSLDDIDRQDLERRGLTTEQIKEVGAFSTGSGYIVPIRDLDGLLVGGQIRKRDAQKGGRYRWATIGGNQLPDTRELPLTHHFGSKDIHSIYLVEGTGIKPFLASKRLGGVVIGAAGGQFASSPKTLKLAIDKYPYAVIYLVPDGGAVANPNVTRQYQAVRSLLKSWGKELNVIWWNQMTKEMGDIDEISADTKIDVQSWDKFMGIGQSDETDEKLVPLDRFLTPSHRELLETGTNEKKVRAVVRSIAQDAYGCKNSLDERYEKYQGTVETIVEEFNSKCNPPLTLEELKSILADAAREPDNVADSRIDRAIGAWKRDNPVPEIVPTTDPEGKPVPRFESTPDSGLVRVAMELRGEKFIPATHLIGNHLVAIAYINTPEGNGSALHLEFKSIRHQIIRWTMPRAFIVAETAEMLGELVGRGYQFKLDRKKYLIEYLNSLGGEIEKTYTVTDSTGWTNGSFVTQNITYGDESLKFRDIEPSAEALSEIVGTLNDWKSQVAARCAGNSRLIFALGTAFAAPLLPIIGLESGGFHLIGGTSAGKTTTLKVAASVVGFKEIPHWRTTTNGLESIACAHNHTLLPLDEIGQADPKDVGSIAYMLANGQGKTRMNKNLTNRKPKTWQLLFLSSGEIGMGAYIAQAGISLKGGQEVRMPDIPAVPPGSTTGVFEDIHSCESSKQFAQALEYATTQQRGTALDAFLAKLTADLAKDKNLGGVLAKRMYLIAGQLSEGLTDHAVSRVANRFALVQVALGLAHENGLLPFPVEQIEWAIKTVFTDWLNHRGGDGSIEIKNACDRIERLIVANEFSDRVYDVAKGDKGDPQIVRNLIAYRTTDGQGNTDELWVPTAVFDKEFCDGTNKSELVKELQRREWLAPPRADGKATLQRKIKTKRAYYFVFQVGNFPDYKKAGESSESGESGTDNPLLESITHTYISTHQGILPSESGESGTDTNKPATHSTHQGILPSESGKDEQTPMPATVLGTDSLNSPDSLQKNDSKRKGTLENNSEANEWDE